MESKNFEKGGEIRMDELFTVNEMLAKLKISRTKLWYLMNKGDIPFIKVGESPRFVASEVMKSLRKQTVQGNINAR